MAGRRTRGPGGACRGWRGLLCCAVVLLLMVAMPAWPSHRLAAGARGEYEVKAAFLLNFAKFVSWPATVAHTAPDLTLCVLGTDPFGAHLDALEGADVHGESARVRRIETPRQGVDCRVVFISQSESDRLATVLATLAGHPVLTVGDMPGFAERGGMINLVLRDRRIRFRINHEAARAAGLTLSAHLLRLADIVEGQVPS